MSHEQAQVAILVTPRIGFLSIHGDRELTLTRLPCSKEAAESWVEQVRGSLKDRFIWAEIKEVEV